MDIDASSLIDPKIAIALWILGLLIKHVPWQPIKDISNKFIPALLIIVGIIISTVMAGDVTLDAVISGAITALFAVGVHASGKNIFGELIKSGIKMDSISVTDTDTVYKGSFDKDTTTADEIISDEVILGRTINDDNIGDIDNKSVG